jgi:hypothetical protein
MREFPDDTTGLELLCAIGTPVTASMPLSEVPGQASPSAHRDSAMATAQSSRPSGTLIRIAAPPEVVTS